MNFLGEAFKRLNTLQEDTFDITDNGIQDLTDTLTIDDEDETLDIIDDTVDTYEELQPNYLGKVILDCNVCHSLVYKDKADVTVDEETDSANVSDECPYCMSTDGFKIVGEVAPYSDGEVEVEIDGEPVEVEETEEVEVEDDDLEEGYKRIRRKALRESKNKISVYDYHASSPDFESFKSIVGKTIITDKNLWCDDADAFDYEEDMNSVLNAGLKLKGDKLIIPKGFKAKITAVDASADGWNPYMILSTPTGDVEYFLDFQADDNLEHFLIEENMDESLKESRGGSPIKKLRAKGIIKGKNVKEAFLDDVENTYIDAKEEEVEESLTEDRGGMSPMDKLRAKGIIGSGVDESLNLKEGKYLKHIKANVDPDEFAAVLDDVVDESLEEDLNAQIPLSKFSAQFGPEYKISKSGDIYKDGRKLKWRGSGQYGGKTDVTTKKGMRTTVSQLDIKEFVWDHEDLFEGFNDVSLTTDDQHMQMTSEENGKVTVTTEPIEQDFSTYEGDEMIAPVDADLEAEIDAEQEPEDFGDEEGFGDEEEFIADENGETEVDMEDFDEESFDEVTESYLREVYSNVKNFKTTGVSRSGRILTVEGVITFKSGKSKNTSFLFEAVGITKRGKIRLVGMNESITRGKKPYTMIGQVKNKKLMVESFNYNYRQKDMEGRSVRLYNTCKRSK